MLSIEEIKQLVIDEKTIHDMGMPAELVDCTPFPTSIVNDVVYYSTGDKENTHKLIENEDGTLQVKEIKA